MLDMATRAAAQSGRRQIVALAVAGVAVALLLAATAGFPKLAAGGADNDSLMRMVVVRDLIAGQAWYDSIQHRMGIEPGLSMHWSRLVDAPLALLFSVLGESAAAFLWPSLLLGAALVLVLHIAERIADVAARFPALVLAVVAFHFMGIFQPGTFDHHNVQLVLVLAAVAGLLASSFAGGILAGATCALSLAVGLETLPLVAVLGAVAAVGFVLEGPRARGVSSGFGLAFAAAAAIVLPLDLPPSAWWQVACDAYSGPHALVAILSGLGLAAASLSRHRSLLHRAVATALLAAIVAAAVITLLPACLGDPYAGLDPRLRSEWLGWVIEAQPIARLLAHDPVQAATHHATPILALILLVTGRSGIVNRRHAIMLGAVLLVAVALSWWQLRGAVFSLALAVPVLASWVAAARAGAAGGGAVPSVRLVAVWLLSFNVAWGLAIQGALWLAPASPARDSAAMPASSCHAPEDYASLAGEPATRVLAISNLGAPILAYTHHRALAGPYHRNAAGNLLVLDALTGSEAEARAIVSRHGIGLLAVCPGNPESRVLADRAPDGLLAGILGGIVPPWLEPVGGKGGLQVYRADLLAAQ